LKLQAKDFKFHLPIIKEITSLSLVSFSRQGVVSILAIILNHTLYSYGGEHSIVYGIISKTLIFTLPVLGITQGFIPIAGYNYGAENYERVKHQISIKYAALLATLVLSLYSLRAIICHFY
jgi:Na+-driven multidrug efflux pump